MATLDAARCGARAAGAATNLGSLFTVRLRLCLLLLLAGALHPSLPTALVAAVDCLVGGRYVALVVCRAAAPFAYWTVIHPVMLKQIPVKQTVQNRSLLAYCAPAGVQTLLQIGPLTRIKKCRHGRIGGKDAVAG